jgi:hypothetical protein
VHGITNIILKKCENGFDKSINHFHSVLDCLFEFCIVVERTVEQGRKRAFEDTLDLAGITGRDI